ncbi:MAG: hypothetical protein DHS20C14_15330 [Phycisphaeraceae bacterium]|nr:MAG: hypothetical protein DHS20C14_15330 [Phycisphaeraceae bacterium]
MTNLRRVWIIAAILGMAGVGAGVAPAQLSGFGFEDDSPKVQTEIHASAARVAPGDRVIVAVVLDHARGYHSWPAAELDVLPADIAEFAVTTTIEPAALPAWASARRVQWPEPHLAPVPDVSGSGGSVDVLTFSGRAVAYVPVVIADDAPVVSSAELTFALGYQTCNDTICLMPEFMDLAVTLEVVAPGAGDAPETGGDFAGFDPAGFDAAAADRGKGAGDSPEPDRSAQGVLERVIAELEFAQSHAEPGMVTATWVDYTPDLLARARDSGHAVFVDFTAEWCINCKVFEAQVLDKEPTRSLLRADDVVMLKVDMTGANPDGEALLASLNRVGIPAWAVYSPDEDLEPEVVTTYSSAGVRGAIDRALGRGDASPADSSEGAAASWFGIPIPQGSAATLLVTGLFALAGGFILNLTPCVLPVIPIKILTIGQHAGESRSRALFLGFMMALGVVAFWFGLGVPVAVASGVVDPSRVFGLWYVTLPLGALIVLMSLGLMGVFTVNLPQKAYLFNPKADNASGSFLFGVMAGVLGLPCFGLVAGALIPTAASLGWVAVLVIFTALGVGMALPYLVLSAYPKLLGFVPKTGPASGLVKEFLGFLMIAAGVYFFGTGVISLVDTYPFLGRDVHVFFVSLTVLIAGAWLAYRTVRITPSAPRRVVFGGLGLLLIAGAVWLSVSVGGGKLDEHRIREGEFARLREDEAQRVAALERALATATAELRELAAMPEVAGARPATPPRTASK